MSYNYVVTAQRPTGVWDSISGKFFNGKETNLLLNKLTRFELYTLKNDMVETVQEFNLNARVSEVKAFRKPNSEKDLLFVLTEKFQILIFEFIKREKVHMKTIAFGMVTERSEPMSDTGVLVAIDSKSRVAVLRIYDSCLYVINLDFKDEELSFYDLPVEDAIIASFDFLDPMHEVKPKLPLLSVLAKERKRTNLKTYEITDDRSLRATSFKQDSVETSAQILIPVSEPYGGIIIIGNQNIAYFRSPNESCVIAPGSMELHPIACYCRVLPTKFLLGDLCGNLYFLSLDKEGSDFSLKFFELGTTVSPTSLAYLDNNYVFVGSKFGDSQLIKLSADRSSDSFLQILDSFISLAPVSDMVIVDLEKQGQNQIVACCGAHKDGSLRVIRNGIGINEHGSIDLDGADGIFSISVKNSYHDYVILCLPTETKMLKFVGEDIEQLDLPFIGTKNDTIFCGNLTTDVIVHVAGNVIQLLSSENFDQIHEHNTGSLILHFVMNRQQIVFSTEKQLCYAEISEDNKVSIVSVVPVESQISAIDITPLADDQSSKFCALTYWQLSTVQILSLPDLKVVHKDKLEHNSLPRSVLISSLDENCYVFVGMGDGQLIHYNIEPETGQLQSQKKILIGCKAVSLKHFYSNGTKNIFACTDRPTVIYSRNNKLVFSTVNLRQVFSMSNLNTVSFPNSIILACEHQVIIGQIDQIQKLHILKVDLGEHPRRITYQDSTHTFGLATTRVERKTADGTFEPLNPNCISAIAQTTLPASGITGSSPAPFSSREQNLSERDIHHFLVLNPSTFEVFHSHKFTTGESIISVNSCKLADDPNEYFFVGTASISTVQEVSHGKILVFSYAENRLQQVAERETRGTPYVIREFNGKLLVAVNAHVNIFEWNSSSNELQDLCSISYSLNTLQIKTQGDFIVASDLVRSVKLFNFMPMSSNLVEIGRHEEISHPGQIEFIDDDNYIMTDVFMNVCSLKKEMFDEISGKSWIVPYGCFHLGLMVNSFCKGSLVNNQPCEILDNLRQKPILFATMEGCLGMICQMSRSWFVFLNALQENIIKHEQCLGNLSLKTFRQFHSLVRTDDMQNFIDGDLIETFLDFSREKMLSCIEGLKLPNGTPASLDDVTKMVEELSRIH